MRNKICVIILTILLVTISSFALEPNEILVIANGQIPESVELAQYYATKRRIPSGNMVFLRLGSEVADSISRNDYNEKIVYPIRKSLSSADLATGIKCLVTTYGVPFKIGTRPIADKDRDKLNNLQKILAEEKTKLQQLEQNTTSKSTTEKETLTKKTKWYQYQIDSIIGKETDASLDSELSMVLYKNYELYRWQINRLNNSSTFRDHKTMMVSRLDGPGSDIAKSLVDKAIKAEKNGLKGTAYIDSRGIENDNIPNSFGWFDQSLRDLALMIQSETDLGLVEEKTESLFSQGQCPNTALYCGWYSLRKYIDAFDFVDGAIGYHIASFEAVDLRNPASEQWCPAMVKDGIAATIGAVAEPYLNAFPSPKDFFAELLRGSCLAEAYYHTKPFNSWQLLLIGDPLYTPFKQSLQPSGLRPYDKSGLR